MLNIIDWSVIILVVLALIFIVKKFSATIKDAEDYYAAAGSIPFSLLVGTLVATWYGGAGCLNSVASGAASGMASWGIYCVGAHLARIPLALYLAPEVAVRTEMTIPLMIKKAFGSAMALFVACYFLIGFTNTNEIVGMRNVVSGLWGEGVGTPVTIALLIGIVLLTIFGGLIGVAVTDMMLFWCMCTAIALAVPAMWGDVGGWGGLLDKMTAMMGAEEAAKMLNPVFGSDTLGLVTLLVMSLGVYVNAGLYQRFRAADTPRNASRSYLTAFCIFICLDFLLTLGGLLALALDPNYTNIQVSYINLVAGHLPHGLRALFVVGILGAIISTIDSYLLIGGMTIANDIIGNFKKLTDKQSITYGKYGVVALAIVGYLMATQFTTTLQVTKFLSTMQMAIIFPASLIGIFYKGRKSVFSGWATLVVGGVIYFYLNFVNYMGFNGMLVALPVAFLTFFLTKGIGKDTRELAQP